MSTPPSWVFTPSGQAPPAEVVDATHHGAWIIIPTAIGLTLLLVSLLIRFYVRVAVAPLSGLGDIVLVVAAVRRQDMISQDSTRTVD